jgi:hypothetical protein
MARFVSHPLGITLCQSRLSGVCVHMGCILPAGNKDSNVCDTSVCDTSRGQLYAGLPVAHARDGVDQLAVGDVVVTVEA